MQSRQKQGLFRQNMPKKAFLNIKNSVLSVLYAYSAKHLLFISAYNGLFTARNSIKTAHNCIFTVSDVARADPKITLYR